jgi:hypothetical protein
MEGRSYYFELGEIADAGLAMNYSHSLKTGEITGGAFSQEMPLIELIRKKTGRSYETNGTPVDLVLYYDKQYPHEQVLAEYISKYSSEIEALISAVPFQRVWIFDHSNRKVLWRSG